MAQELYDLPKGWEWKGLASISKLITDGTHHSPKKQYPTGGENRYKYLTSKNVKFDGLKMDNISYVDESIHDEIYNRCSPEYLDQLITKDGAMTGTCCLNTLKEPFSLLSSVALIKLKRDQVTPHFLNKFLSSPEGQDAIIGEISGAAITRTTLTKLKATQIPVPPLAEQERIVGRLDALFSRIDQTIAQLKHTQAQTQALWASALDAAFQDCKSKYENIPLSEVAEVGRGKSKHRPRNEKSLFGGKYPFVQTGDVRAAKKYITASTSNYSEKGLAQSKLWPVGTVCITIAANIGDVAILGIDACFPDSVVGISSAENSNEFIYYFLITLQRQLDLQANSAAQKNINLKVLSGIQIPLPTLPEQASIVSQLDALSERTQALAATTTRQIDQLTALKASLLDAAFRGQL